MRLSDEDRADLMSRERPAGDADASSASSGADAAPEAPAAEAEKPEGKGAAKEPAKAAAAPEKGADDKAKAPASPAADDKGAGKKTAAAEPKTVATPAKEGEHLTPAEVKAAGASTAFHERYTKVYGAYMREAARAERAEQAHASIRQEATKAIQDQDATIQDLRSRLLAAQTGKPADAPAAGNGKGGGDWLDKIINGGGGAPATDANGDAIPEPIAAAIRQLNERFDSGLKERDARIYAHDVDRHERTLDQEATTAFTAHPEMDTPEFRAALFDYISKNPRADLVKTVEQEALRHEAARQQFRAEWEAEQEAARAAAAPAPAAPAPAAPPRPRGSGGAGGGTAGSDQGKKVYKSIKEAAAAARAEYGA